MTPRAPVHTVHLGAATLLRVSAEGLGTGLVLVVQARTGQAALAGFLQAGVMLPYVVAGPAVGHALDRTRRPRTFALALAGCYVLAAALLMLVAGRVPLLLALVLAVAVGCTEPIVVALTGLLPRFVPAHRLTGAYGLEAATYNVAAITGPGLAAALAAGPGAGYAGLAVVGSAALGLVLLPFLAVPPAPPAGPRPPEARWPLLEVIAGGLVVLAANRVLRAVTCATTMAFLGMGGVAVTAVLFAEHLGEPAGAGGRLIAAFAAGSLAGSLASARWLSARRAERVLLAGMVAFGLALASITLAPSMPWALAGFALAGVCDGPVFAATLTVRQREAPADRLGQVNTTGGSLKIGSAALGAALTGALAAHLGATGLLLAIACCQLLGALAGALLLIARKPA
ncbi:MFS transporter [Thermomonospora cellulosilytica]|uniref:MFS family permease n=1 Tax=Thermomonospora cellulosilytica TaxID=1411118 RepID=A0A7W3R774_9ACTN|nr:MFS transporter [Thermomonospora cellulosilytica]MBA9002311.1 MFS family permease [Thermomonospora cellulosilytica]